MSSPSVISIKSEEEEVTVTASSSKPNARWQRLREVLLQRGSPICRFRTEVFWRIGNAYLGNVNVNCNVFIISIRAVGPRSQVEEDSSQALFAALQSLEITPKLLQRQAMDGGWPNHWLVHINPQDASRLPSYTDKNKGIFWNPAGDPFLFVWTVVPENPHEEQLLEGRRFRFEVHIPATHPYSSTMPEDLWKDIRLEPPEVESAPLSVVSAKYLGEKFGGTMIKNGNFSLEVDKIPDAMRFRSFVKNPRLKTLVAWGHGTELNIDMVPACETCGAEGHTESDCVYELALDALVAQLGRSRTHLAEKDQGFVVRRHCNEPASKRRQAAASKKKSSNGQKHRNSTSKKSRKTHKS